MSEPLARIAGAIPLGASVLSRQMPGRVGTTTGMVASVDEYRRMQREMFDLVEHFVVLNETARRMLLANGSPAAKLSLNRLGLSQSNVARKPSPEVQPTERPVRFGFVGRIHPSKGLTELVRAAVSLPRACEFSLAIRGPAVDAFTRAYADELRVRAGGDPRITFSGPVPSREIPDVVSRFDVLLIPSMWFENGPTIALESMAVGTPIVASRVGNLPEIVEDGITGCLVPAGDVRALAAALQSIVEDPAGSVDRWRSRLPTPRTMDDVTVDYLSMYAA
jgi:glycosyltransferase involved in cell wall biosynthesis